jgi:hypothetical protein
VYQFHLSILLHYIIATQLPDTPLRCQNEQSTGGGGVEARTNWTGTIKEVPRSN